MIADDADNGMLALAARLFPIARSICGPGLRETLEIISEYVPLTITETPTGTPVFDWTVPREWTLRRATLRGPDGNLIVDTTDGPAGSLGVINFSVPVRGCFTLDQLRPRLHSSPDRPDATPYRTSYHTPAWGFCLPHKTLSALPTGNYEVDIDTSIDDGALSIGEAVIPGDTADEIFFSAHCCHPALANDNLSGIVVAVELIHALLKRKRGRYTYRFVFAPGTIGAITWLATHADVVPRIKHGLVLSCLGDKGEFHYKRSRRGNAEIDRVVEAAVPGVRARDFIPYGYDERQYCSPGFNLPVGNFMRTPNGEYPEYHSSDDDLSILQPSSLSLAVDALIKVIDALEGNARYVNQNPFCEPQLGRRGLYASMGGHADAPQLQMALLWVLNYSDRLHDLADIALKSKLPMSLIIEAAELLKNVDLLRPTPL